jgi:threonine/homoserine/homoserine lactone efflux protein
MKTTAVVAQLAASWRVSVAVICTPGPDTALTVRNALAGGRRAGVWTAAGVAIGQSIWTVAASAGVAGLLRQGVLNDLGNPKMAAFFVSLLRQFIPDGRAAFARFLLLGLLFCLMTFTWLAAYSYAIGKVRELLAHPRVRSGLDAITGCVLIAFGVRLAAERR